ncbi:MAG: Holliday junction branch migration protein RuvA [Lachnospiraceae bacterium]|jgi:Holliday junction DNA helicase RuvA
MISYIKGEAAEIFPGSLVVETGGIGYMIFVPDNCDYTAIKRGDTVKIWTYLSVSQDALSLYGFLTSAEAELFKKLITVSGIGPKGAVAILSKLSVNELQYAILTEDAAAISAAPGIGKKTAGKLILELKDKIDKEFFNNIEASDGNYGVNDISDAASEAVMALISLGYGKAEASAAVKKAASNEAGVEEILSSALRFL